jgi:hypothetical protein
LEFFATSEVEAKEMDLQRRLTVGALAELCDSIDSVLRDEGDEGEIYCVWGQFRVRREPIRGGVRFTLPRCPNALAWTVTGGEEGESGPVVIHCTINRRGHEPEFVESIRQFVNDWRRGLERDIRKESGRTQVRPTSASL